MPGNRGSRRPPTPGDASGRPTFTAARRSGPVARICWRPSASDSQGTLDLLCQGRPTATEDLETLVDVGRIAAEDDDGGDQLRGWWLYCMLQGGHPLREKMTLFWHNHFATSLAKVQDPVLMFGQNCLLRTHALGRFGPLLQAISRDAAMMVWLDSNSNVKGKPNENYARELMELFSLGVGHYTEKDIREAARAFTGWRTDGVGFAFDARLHDGGAKTILGQTGDWDGGDVVRIVLEQPAAARFLVRKLYHFFVSEKAVPPDVTARAALRVVPQERLRHRGAGADHPGLAAFLLGPCVSAADQGTGRVRAGGGRRRFIGAMARMKPTTDRCRSECWSPWLGSMGQRLFEPPNVKGWPGGPSWLNTSTMLARDNFAGALAMGTLWSSPAPESIAA